MSVIDEVAKIRKDIEQMKLQRERLKERLDSEKAEKERLLEEAKLLGVPEPSQLKEWVAEQQRIFDEKKAEIERLLREAEK